MLLWLLNENQYQLGMVNKKRKKFSSWNHENVHLMDQGEDEKIEIKNEVFAESRSSIGERRIIFWRWIVWQTNVLLPAFFLRLFLFLYLRKKLLEAIRCLDKTGNNTEGDVLTKGYISTIYTTRYISVVIEQINRRLISKGLKDTPADLVQKI